jgi:rubredoxin
MLQKKDKQNKKANEECPLCKISEETLKRLKEAKGTKKSLQRKGFFGKVLAILSAFLGGVAGTLGIIGTFGWCCLPLTVAILGIFGISAGVLMAYNKILIGASLLLIGMAIWLFFQQKKKTSLYKCPECGFLYEEKKWAEKCEAWCKEHKSCNIEIAKHAVKNEKNYLAN